MLGSDRFAFENGNVIDPGDLPPGQPTRNTASTTTTPSTVETTSSDDDDVNYNEARESAARLLNDISDLNLSPVKKPDLSSRLPFRDFPKRKKLPSSASQQVYSPYDDDNNQEPPVSHSLPSVDEARIHAASLLASSSSSSHMSPQMGRTLKLQAPYNNKNNKGLVRQRVCSVGLRVALVALVIGAIIGIGVGVGVAVMNKKNSGGGGGGSTWATRNKNAPTFGDASRYQAAVEYFSETGISSKEDLLQDGSPQNKAANWIALQDQLQYVIPDAAVTDTKLIQRYVLAVFYFATGGPDQWDHSAGFTSNQDECAWNDVIAVPEYIVGELAVGASCDSELRVNSLFVPGNQLKGSLPSELAQLSHLTLLGLSDNELKGSLPNLETLDKLLYVNLNANTFTGSIPEYLGDFQRLQVLGLGANAFSGSVPASLGALGALKTLAMDQNKLTGTLDFCRFMTSVEYFYVDHNNFSGDVGDEFFENMQELVQLDVSDNNLSGNMPLDGFFHEYNLEVLDLANNKFTGGFPDYIEEDNVVLHYLNLRGNQFGGQIPLSIANLEELQHLDLQHNQFSGYIPNTIGRLTELTYLFLGHNNFETDSIVPPLNQLDSMRELSLAGIGLNGTIPDWLLFMDELEMLDLSFNSLTGAIPENIWNLPSLFYLILHNNKLTGVPPSGGDQIELLTIHKNNLGANVKFDAVCDAQLVSADCSAGCTKACCKGDCCPTGDDDCYQEEIDFFVDGIDYQPSPLSFDPDILDEAGVITTFPEEDLGDIVDP